MADERGPLRVAHLTTVDMSLALLLGPELAADVAEGFEVYGISAPGPYVDRVTALGATHVAVPQLTRQWDVRADMAAARRLATIIRSLHLDVLHTHTPKAGVLGRIAGRRAGVPIVVNTCHGLWAQPGDPWARRAMTYLAEAVAARWSDFELYQNGDDHRRLRHVVPARRSRVVGNGVDLGRFRFDPAGRERVRAERGIGPGDLVVGAVGRRVAEKGLAEFGAAARTLATQARFVWVGPDEPDIRGRRPRDEQGVDFWGGRDDMPAVYSAFDVFALPSYREGFSRSAMEAAACGRPMVLSNIRGCREIGTDGEHVLLVRVRDAGALTGAIRTLLDDADERVRLGKAAEARAATEFDQQRVARASIETYHRVATAKGLGW